MTPEVLAKEAVKILDEKKGENIKLIQTTALTVIADYFVIVNGTSNIHVKALAEELDEKLSGEGVEPGHIEGKATGWILLDYGSVVIHVFTKEAREYYSLEKMWADGTDIDISDIISD